MGWTSFQRAVGKPTEGSGEAFCGEVFFLGGAFFGFATLGTEIERTNTVGN